MGAAQALALNDGYRLAFALGALFALGAALLGALLLRPQREAPLPGVEQT
jgi:hypothetical protein